MKKPKLKRQSAHPFAYEGLDRVMHERARLAVLMSLFAHPQGLSFAAIKKLCGLTDGNLSRHLEVLESAKLVEIAKSNAQGRPRSICHITVVGRKRFVGYLSELEQVLLDAGASTESEPVRPGGLLPIEGR